MQEFRTSDLLRDSGVVFDALESDRAVSIRNQRRPKMVLITEEYLNSLLSSKTQREVFKEMQA